MEKKLKINLSSIPIESSLGLLAAGDLAFVEWRKIKSAQNALATAESKKGK